MWSSRPRDLVRLVFVAQGLAGHPVHEMQAKADRASHRIIERLLRVRRSALSNPVLDVHAGARATEKDMGHAAL